jgi:hypothetical protein
MLLIPSVEFRLRYSVANSICLSIVSLWVIMCSSEYFRGVFNSRCFTGRHLPVVRPTSSSSVLPQFPPTVAFTALYDEYLRLQYVTLASERKSRSSNSLSTDMLSILSVPPIVSRRETVVIGCLRSVKEKNFVISEQQNLLFTVFQQ